MSRNSNETRLPVTVIAGFLGSGKTTLLNHMLVHQHGVKTGVIVNEIGEIGIDAVLDTLLERLGDKAEESDEAVEEARPWSPL